MQSNQYPNVPENGLVQLANEIRAIKERVTALQNGLLSQAGISVEPGIFRVLESLAVDGSMTANGSITSNGSMTSNGDLASAGTLHVTGEATFDDDLNVNGSAVVAGALESADFTASTGWQLAGSTATFNTINLRSGIVGEDALSNPVRVVGAVTQTATGWAVGTGMTAMAGTSIPIPAGFSRASVSAWASMHFQDSSPNGGWVRAVIAGNAGAEMGGLANLNIGCAALHSIDLTGLAGGTITLQAQVRASVASGVGTGRIAQISGLAVFTR